MKLSQIKSHLRYGQYAWPGGYPMFFICADGGILSFAAVRQEWRQVCRAMIQHDKRSDWYVVGCDINWEDPHMECEHTGERIESAYAD